MRNYLIIIEKAKNNYSAYAPDVEGCVSTGKTPEDAKANLKAALELHIQGLIEDGLPIPEPVSTPDYAEVG